MNPLSGSPAGPPWREMSISRAFLYISFWIPNKKAPTPGSPNRAPTERDAPFLEPSFNYLSKFPVNGPPSQVPQRGERHPFPLPPSMHPLLTHFSLKVPSKVAPSIFRKRCSISRANGLIVHLYLSESPVKELSHKMGGNIWSPSREPHVDVSPTYNGVRPGSPRGSFTTLLSLPQCHAAFRTIPSTLAWVDQSPVSQHVS